ncbi:FkbM family methyltransferase [Phenylobacterium sp. VNQ135]|uniref:FkbM family methyltransferase n=1 Tax=Phenylobacterium sp. VNQ135 TaxID=3400922 RepID=UPI003BFAEAB9
MNEPAAQMYETRDGRMLGLRGDAYVSRSLELYGELSPPERQLLEQLVRPGQTVVEVGANIGAFTLALARRCAPGPLYAFEPQQRIFQLLCANLALNDIGNVVALPEACGDAEGQALIPPIDYAGQNNFGGVSLQPAAGAARGQRVRVRTLDSLDLPACHLLKVDVEGFEPQVLRGARETILRTRPILYVENDRAAQQGEVIGLMADMGYRLYWHTPALYAPGNFKGETQNVFGRIVSVNVLGLPRETGRRVGDAEEIDPANWASPVRVG